MNHTSRVPKTSILNEKDVFKCELEKDSSEGAVNQKKAPSEGTVKAEASNEHRIVYV